MLRPYDLEAVGSAYGSGQAFILVMLAIYIHGKAYCRPQAFGIQDRLHGHQEGLRRTGWI